MILYKLTNRNIILKFDGNAYTTSFPAVHDNAEYDQYLKWLEEGNTPEPVEAESVESKEILRSTIIERLEAINKFDDAITIMEQPENLRAKYKWFSMVAIRIDDFDVRAVLNAISVNPDEILY